MSVLACIVLNYNVLCVNIADADALTQAGEAARRRRSQSRSRRSSHSHGDNITSCCESEDQVIDSRKIIIMGLRVNILLQNIDLNQVTTAA